MNARSFIDSLYSNLRSFWHAREANIVVPFTLAMIPMMGFVGAAVDYSRANSDKAAMQAALDSTALMMQKTVTSLNQDQIGPQATNYFKSIFHRPEVQNVIVTPAYSAEAGTQIILTASGTVDTTFMKVMGKPTLTLTASTTVKWGNTRLRVALVLDNTGSMSSSGKMTALKTAAKNLLTQLQNAASQDGDVYVSIIPFAKDVSIGSSNYNQTWIKWSGGSDTWDENNGACSKSGYTKKSTCIAQGTCSKTGYYSQSTCTATGTCSVGSYSSQSTCQSGGVCSISGHSSQSSCTSAGVCSNSRYTTQSTCTSHSATWTWGVWTAGVWTPATWTQATWTPASHSTWSGCIMDRDQNYDTTNDAPSSGDPSTLFPAEQYSGYCPTPLMGLSYDWTALAAKVDAMQPAGSTNQAIGLQWGYQSLTSSPFTIPAMDSKYKYTQVIVLLTDGLNTQDRWYGDGYNVSTQVDDRQQITCNNINAAGITLYTVQVNTGSDPTSTLLQRCAGSPGNYPDSSKFFLLTTANQIITTFAQIGTQLSNLRIAY